MKPFAVITPTMGMAPTFLAGLIESCRVEDSLCDLVLVWNHPSNPCPYPDTGNLSIVNPGKNLGWLEGTNFGVTSIDFNKYESVVFCNDDVVLMEGFFTGLLDALQANRASIFSPVFNSGWKNHFIPHKQSQPQGGFLRKGYKPISEEREMKALDGTCLVVPRQVILEVGLLDEAFSVAFGWGAIADYCYRARTHPSRYTVRVTGRCAFEHGTSPTADSLLGQDYRKIANEMREKVMKAKYPDCWRELLKRE